MTALAIACLLLIACSGDPSPGTATATAGSGGAAPTLAPSTPTAEPATTTPAAATATTPAGAGGSVAAEPVALEAADGTVLRGYLYAPSGPRRRVLLLISSLPQSTWRPYAGEFAARGIALMTLDLRGQGETGGALNPAQTQRDATLATLFLKSREYPLVYLFGMGAQEATAAFRVAGEQDLAGVGGLPAGGNSSEEIARVAEPKLFMAFEADAESVRNIDRLLQAATGTAWRVILPQPSSPTTDVLSLATVRQALIDFVSQ